MSQTLGNNVDKTKQYEGSAPFSPPVELDFGYGPREGDFVVVNCKVDSPNSLQFSLISSSGPWMTLSPADNPLVLNSHIFSQKIWLRALDNTLDASYEVLANVI